MYERTCPFVAGAITDHKDRAKSLYSGDPIDSDAVENINKQADGRVRTRV